MSLDNVTPIDALADKKQAELDAEMISDLRIVREGYGAAATMLVSTEELDALFRRIDKLEKANAETLDCECPSCVMIKAGPGKNLPRSVTQAMEVVEVTIEPEPVYPLCRWCGAAIVADPSRLSGWIHLRDNGSRFHPAEIVEPFPGYDIATGKDRTPLT